MVLAQPAPAGGLNKLRNFPRAQSARRAKVAGPHVLGGLRSHRFTCPSVLLEPRCLCSPCVERAPRVGAAVKVEARNGLLQRGGPALRAVRQQLRTAPASGGQGFGLPTSVLMNLSGRRTDTV